MAPVVRSLILKGFRSLPNTQIDFDNPTFLVGRNGAGKSNIGDALRFIAEAMTSGLREAIDKRGGITSVRTQLSRKGLPKSFGLGVVCGVIEDVLQLGFHGEVESGRYAFEIGPLANYDFEVLREQCIIKFQDESTQWFDRHGNKGRTNIKGFDKIDFFTPSSLAMPIVAGAMPFEIVAQVLRRMKTYAIEPAALRELQDPDSGTDLRADGRNAASVFEEIERRSPDSIERIKEILAAIVPNTTGLDTVQHGRKLALEFVQAWDERNKLTFEAHSMSDGTLRALGLLLAVYQVQKPSLIFVDEPEASIHPGAAAAVLDTLRHAASTMQVVISTQSPEMLDAKWIEDRHIRGVVWQEGSTHIEEIPQNAKRALRDHLMGAGELFRSGVLEPSLTQQELKRPEVKLFEDIPNGHTANRRG